MPSPLVIGHPIARGGDLLQNFQLQQLTPATADALHRYGDAQIASATIVRTPLSGMLTGAIDAISGNAYSRALKANSYDSYFHLCIEFRTTKGTISLEQNETVLLSVGSTQKQNSQTYPVPSFPRVTVRQVMLGVKRIQGPKLYRYNASSNNCQIFIRDVLRGVGVQDTGAFEFVVQDTASIFRGQPTLRKVANTVTDLAGIAQHARQIPRLLQRKILQKTGLTKYEDRARNLYDRTVGRATRGVRRFLGFGLGGFDQLNVKQLKELCKNYSKSHAIKGYSRLKKDELVEVLKARFKLESGTLLDIDDPEVEPIAEAPPPKAPRKKAAPKKEKAEGKPSIRKSKKRITLSLDDEEEAPKPVDSVGKQLQEQERVKRNDAVLRALPRPVFNVYRSILSAIAEDRHVEAGMDQIEFYRYYHSRPGSLMREYFDDVNDGLREETFYPRSASRKKSRR